MTANEIDALQKKLLELRIEHRELDIHITEMSANPYVDQLELQRLKRRRLQLKDTIARLHSLLIPDLDA